ncbi:MAG: polysaccharide lyase family 7 protein [Pseudoruegeria sp.]
MDGIAAIDTEDTINENSSVDTGIGEADDSSFQTVLNNTDVSDDTDTSTDGSGITDALSAVSDASDALALDDTSENRVEFVSTILDVVDEVDTELEKTNFESSEDLSELTETSEELKSASESLEASSESASSEDAADALSTSSNLLSDMSDSVEMVAEVAAVDAEKGAEMAEDLSAELQNAQEILSGEGSPFEKLQTAASTIGAVHEKFIAQFEAFMGYSFLAIAIHNADDSEHETILQKSASTEAATSESIEEDTNGSEESSSAQSRVSASSADVNLEGWKLTLPADFDGDDKADEIGDDELSSYEGSENMRRNEDGSITFSSMAESAATTANSKYPRSELREMIRAGDTGIGTHDAANNWVTSAASAEEQAAAGGVDGQMTATLSVDRVTEGGDSNQAGRVIIGQVHAVEDEPVRLYFHQAPGSDSGSIYFAHEPQNGEPETFHELIGNTSGTASGGIALGEAFSYDINITGTDLTVSVTRQSGETFSETVDMSQSGYAEAGTQMYFKAGVYSQNSTTDPSTDYAEATFYSLETGHDGEVLNHGADPSAILPSTGDTDSSSSSSSSDSSSGSTGSSSDSTDSSSGSETESDFDTGDSTETSSGSATSGTDSSSGNLSSEASEGSITASEDNQEALEARFIALYERLMEKQISFKERVEPFKTDNQNAGKG